MTILLVLLFSLVAALDCADYTNCSACVNAESWLGNCRWCPKPSPSGNCHAFGSPLNPCHAYENINNDTFCDCIPKGCSPAQGWDSTVCTWYNTSAGDNKNPPADPMTWKGADFLPEGYRAAASCACSGGGNTLWNTVPASCVRTSLLKQHLALNATLRKAMRNASLSSNPLAIYKYVPMVYQMHEDAYAACCCSGHIAAEPLWYGIFFAGKILPCYLNTPIVGADIVSFILEFGRCGCGW